MAIKETVFIICLVLLPLIMEAKQPKEPTKDKKSFVELFADENANCMQICCPDGWLKHERLCYFVEKPANYPTMQIARDRCHDLGGKLPIIRSAEENQFIFDQIKDYQHGISKWGIWLDAHRGADGKFAWGDDTPLDGHYTRWVNGEPNNNGGNEDCVHMYARQNLASFWNDIGCNIALPDGAIVCQKGISF